VPVTAPFLAGQVPTADELNDVIRQMYRHRRTTASTGSTGTEVSVARIDNIPVFAGRLYEARCVSVNIDSSVANDVAHVRFRISTSGVATTASTQLGGGLRVVIVNATFSPIVPFSMLHPVTSDGTLSVLLTIQRVAGSGTVVLSGDAGPNFIDFLFEDLGEDPGSSGVDL
jgi:hypothetical protein